jgi:hypothetical protein
MGGGSSSSDMRMGVPPPPKGELILNTRSRFQLFSIITKCIHFQIERLKNKLAYVEKEFQAKMNNATLACYIKAKRKKEEDRRKEEAHKKVEEGQSSKGPFSTAC